MIIQIGRTLPKDCSYFDFIIADYDLIIHWSIKKKKKKEPEQTKCLKKQNIKLPQVQLHYIKKRSLQSQHSCSYIIFSMHRSYSLKMLYDVLL